MNQKIPKGNAPQKPEPAPQGVEFRRGSDVYHERRTAPTRTALISPEIRLRGAKSIDGTSRFEEFASLARAIRLDIISHSKIAVRTTKPSTFFGTGQVSSMAEEFAQSKIELVLVDTALSPIQQRNLERDLGAKVLDRTALILEIFGERAATREGVLQVELAHLNYQRSRLVRSWTHLERQRGGFGFLGGPGETQIEADRRQLRDRVAS
ncbi:MAG: GTPase HflX, partial [Devosiaceae bacterium]|nr:GTPase HflX [Devosiaceae bacterium]